MTKFDPGILVTPITNGDGFNYCSDCFGPEAEFRTIDSIRESLLDNNCNGPEVVYYIAMDVGKKKHLAKLKELHLLYGVVTYAAGKLGKEPVRSQGHIHKKSTYANNWSTPEVYEIWSGEAIIYMQETANDDPGRCFAVYAKPGEVVIVPPGWAHATISANPKTPLTFGAWCDRDFGFEYDDVRKHSGLAFFPILNSDNKITWKLNKNYIKGIKLIEKQPRVYSEFDIIPQKSIYQQFEEDNNKFNFVPSPHTLEENWKNFIP